MTFGQFLGKVLRRWNRIWLQPIRVFCFHQVSDKFEPETMMECDWIQTEQFKWKMLELKKKYSFISLPDAHEHLLTDKIRIKRFAVLTSDDGWASLNNILPWLAKQNIPLTIFVNPLYLDGKHYRECTTEKYLTKEDLDSLEVQYKIFSVASHGWEHKNVLLYSESEFRDNIEKSYRMLHLLSCYIPYYAYPWGKHNMVSDGILREYGLTPVLMDGMKNDKDPSVIHRELLMK